MIKGRDGNLTGNEVSGVTGVAQSSTLAAGKKRTLAPAVKVVIDKRRGNYGSRVSTVLLSFIRGHTNANSAFPVGLPPPPFPDKDVVSDGVPGVMNANEE